MWRVIWHRDNVQVCSECGRRYVVWMSSDDLYVRVHGSRGGTYCPSCFHDKARCLGLHLMWVPMIWREDGEGSMLDFAAKIGCFQ
jgi:hypothetical protein